MKTIHYTSYRHIGYDQSLALQQRLFDQAIEQKRAGLSPQHHLLFIEHTPVVTMGKHAAEGNVLVPEALLKARGIQYHHTSRGGDATYHGPGQWTIYPIFDLEELGIGVREYVERLEEVVIRLLQRYGLSGSRMAGASGVWMHTDTPFPRKVAAIGIHCSRYITMHGMAFNINTDPSAFNVINPCGFTDRGVTSLHLEVGHELSMEALMEEVVEGFAALFDRRVEPISPLL